MRPARSWVLGGALACALLPVWGAWLSRGGAAPGDAALRSLYRRPADIPHPDENPYSTAKADLGRLLFFDGRLSGSGRTSCATCHSPGLSWGDGRGRAVGEGGTELPLRSPTLLNLAWLPRFGWDGKFPTLESVAFSPITAPANMNHSEEGLIRSLQALPDYVSAFDRAFGEGGVTRPRIEMALATYQRLIVSGEAPFDRWVTGDAEAISPAAKRGFALFNGRAACATCHAGWSFTDGSFHDVGVGQGGDVGRGTLLPKAVTMRYAFKTPTLRDVARRAPYMHDGSVPTLEAVITLYDRGGIERPSRARTVRPLQLTEAEKADLLAFLQTLSDDQPAEAP